MITVQAPSTVTIKPPPPPRWAIVEAPADLADLFDRWLRSCCCWKLTAELTQALYAHRGTRFVTESKVFFIAKLSDRLDEEIVVMPRAEPLNRGCFNCCPGPEPVAKGRAADAT